jgi:hypothetical protein
MMGGESSSKNTQSSTTQPWIEAQPAIKGMLGQVNSNLNNTGLTGAETNALNTIEGNAANASSYAPKIAANANSLLAGGGATNNDPMINEAYKRYVAQTNPLASNTDYNPYNTPGFKDALDTTVSDITNQTNGQFAASGRDMSGMNSQALGRGILQGVSPTIMAQYNANVANQQGAAGNLYGAGNTTAGLLNGTNAQSNANAQAGVQAATDANTAQNAGASSVLQAEAARRGIPVQALGLLAQIGIPIAGLGSQSEGKSDTTQQMSGADQFMKIASGIGSLMPKAPVSFSF